MSMKYYLVDNLITPDPTDWRAVTQHDKTYTMEDLLEMIDFRKVGLSRSQIEAVMEEYGVVLAFILSQGGKVITPLFNITPTVGGVFTDKQDRFDKSRHSVNLRIQPGTQLQKVTGQIEPEKTSGSKPVPVVGTFFDQGSQTTDQQLTPGKIGRIGGTQLKFDPADAQQGIFFIQKSNKKETQVPTGDLLDNTGGTLTFLVPDKLPKGDYTVEVRSTMKGKELRSGKLQDTLTVA